MSFDRGASQRGHRKDYLFYPNKPCVEEDADKCARCAILRLHAIGRTVGQGRGDSVKETNR